MRLLDAAVPSWALTRSNALHGKRVLVTRPAHQSDRFAQALRDAGAQPVLAPVIAFAAPDDVASAERAVRDAATFAWIVFTSANGVAAFFELLDARREDARYLNDAKIAAIGSGTAAALRARGIYPDLVPRTFVAEDLAESLIAAAAPGARLLIFRAQEARDVLPQMLRESGRDPHVVAAYKTVIMTDPQFAQKVEQCDILTFTSASTVQGFAKNLTDPVRASEGKTVACIGPVTAQAARDIGLPVDLIASEFTTAGLIAALEG